MKTLMNEEMTKYYPYLLNREQAARFLGIDPKSFDKYIRSDENLARFMIGKHERFTIQSLISFIEKNKL